MRQLLILPTTSSGRHLTKSGGTPDLTGATPVPPKTNSARGVHAVSTPALENAHEKTEPSWLPPVASARRAFKEKPTALVVSGGD
ncbi:MAG TPA: hypothetical protein DCQ92_17150 [Verrucomicrobia subdivision 3 bacterium]|nr:hypothetical protein [Limisphaerales bacterium]